MSSVCGCRLIPSKEACSGRLRGLHHNAHAEGEVATKAAVQSPGVQVFVLEEHLPSRAGGVKVDLGQRGYASRSKMFLDIDGKMVRNVRSFWLLGRVLVCEGVMASHMLSLLLLQVSATEECVGPMRLTQEPIQVRIKDFTTSGNMLLLYAVGRWPQT